MSLLYKFKNMAPTPIVLHDIGRTWAPGESTLFVDISPERMCMSEDLIREIVAGNISLIDTTTNAPLDPVVAIRHILTGGGRSIVNRDGIQRVHASPRPLSLWTYFTGAGDRYIPPSESSTGGWIVGDGERLLFNLTSRDTSKSVNLRFSEDVHLKDGFIITEEAPFGSHLDMEVIHPQYGVVNCFCRKVPLLQTGWFPLDSDDSGYMPFGLTLRVTVHNASGEFEAPSTFRVSGRIEMYRATTITNPLEISRLTS